MRLLILLVGVTMGVAGFATGVALARALKAWLRRRQQRIRIDAEVKDATTDQLIDELASRDLTEEKKR